MLGGALRSDVRAQGARTSATIQPFTHLQLDMYSRDVYSIADAFTFLTTLEHLERERPAGLTWVSGFEQQRFSFVVSHFWGPSDWTRQAAGCISASLAGRSVEASSPSLSL